MEKDRDAGQLTRVGENWTVEQWLTHWLEDLTAPYVKANTLAGYRVAVNHHLVPGIGKHRLTALRPEHLERLYLRMLSTTTKRGTLTRPATAHQVHRTVRTALNEAVRRGHLAKNPALLARTPRVEDDEIEPYTVDEVQRLFTAAGQSRNGTRWVIALALGLRQGEALGLKWSDLDWKTQTLTVSRSRLRPTYRHGCGGACGRKHAGYCPERIATRTETDSTKSRAGRRAVGLPTELLQLLEAHKSRQAEERLRAAQLWTEGDWIFATEVGGPLNPRTDWGHWKELLARSAIRDGRLHDARHTAATVLLLLGVDQRSMMAIMGWSNPAMANRYAHMIEPIRNDIAGRLSSLLWESDGTGQDTG
ncbi:MAG: site-specific integrase [Lapillicoccus sp.]